MFCRAGEKTLILEGGTEVQNIEGTGSYTPVGYTSWKHFYKCGATRAWPKSCRIFGCSRKATAGAHVKVLSESGIWIMPMCAKHNNPSNTDWMSVNANTTVVWVEDEETSGPPDIPFDRFWSLQYIYYRNSIYYW